MKKCDRLEGKEKKKCLTDQRILNESKECAHAFLRVGCDKKSRFWICFTINAILNAFFIVVMCQLYLFPESFLYVGEHKIFAYMSISYFVLDTILFLVILGDKRFRYLNLMGVVMQYGGRTIIGILMTIYAAVTLPPEFLAVLIIVFFADFFNATLAGGLITEKQAAPLVNGYQKVKKKLV